MRLTFPHLGSIWIPLKAICERLGAGVVVPPPTSKRTLEIGARIAPEFACLPLKINLGNFIEAFELGADTIVMPGGVGPCRFGLYAELERQILEDLGYRFEMVIIEPPQGHLERTACAVRRLFAPVSWRDIASAFRLGWAKLRAVDAVDTLSNALRPFQFERGEVTRRSHEVLRWIDEASTPREVGDALGAGVSYMEDAVPPLEERRRLSEGRLKIAVVGEIYVILEPFANQSVEAKLGDMGVLVHRSLRITDWIKLNVILDLFKLSGRFRSVEMACPYLRYEVGGHGRETIAHTVDYAKRGYDGVIQVAPFTCMPEIVAESVLPKVGKDQGVATMTLIVDEQTGEAGVVTRLEAFVDMLERRRTRRSTMSRAAIL